MTALGGQIAHLRDTVGPVSASKSPQQRHSVSYKKGTTRLARREEEAGGWPRLSQPQWSA